MLKGLSDSGRTMCFMKMIMTYVKYPWEIMNNDIRLCVLIHRQYLNAGNNQKLLEILRHSLP